MKRKYLTSSAKQTKNLGRRLAQGILKNKQDKPARFAGGAFVLALEGDLGSGKTTFLQGFAKGLGVKEKILSPTFVILKKFKIPSRHINISTSRHINISTSQNLDISTSRNLDISKSRHLEISKYHSFYHIDCYRLQNPKEILALGFKEIIANPKNIIAIEWAEKIKKYLPKQTAFLKFEFASENQRKILFSALQSSEKGV